MNEKDKAMITILGNTLYKDPNENFYNVFINYINYWNNYNSNGNKEIDKFWFANGHSICKKYAGADTIFSLWTPIKWVILSLNSKDYTKEQFVKEALKADNIYSFLEKVLPRNNELVISLQEFAMIASYEENVMSVPIIKKNIKDKKLNINCYRGSCYYDQMPVMLYCLLNGVNGGNNSFSQYFEDNTNNTLEKTKENILNWMQDNKLEIFFNNNQIKVNDVKRFYNLRIDLGIACNKKEKVIDKDQLKIMLDKYIELIKERENIKNN